jgi:hypothetical protein
MNARLKSTLAALLLLALPSVIVGQSTTTSFPGWNPAGTTQNGFVCPDGMVRFRGGEI